MPTINSKKCTKIRRWLSLTIHPGNIHHSRFKILPLWTAFLWSILFSPVALTQELISNFNQGFGTTLEFERNFGRDIESERAPTIINDRNFVQEGNGALRLRSDNDFSEGFIVGSVFNFVPVADIAGTYNSISYWV